MHRLRSAARRGRAFPQHRALAAPHPPADLPPSKLLRGNPAPGMRIGDSGAMGRILVAGEPGNGIVDEVAPLPGEKLVFKPGKGAFCGTDLAAYLAAAGVTHLLFAGVTTEVGCWAGRCKPKRLDGCPSTRGDSCHSLPL